MTFRDTDLERIYRLNYEALVESDEDQRQICGLFAAYGWFRLIEGEQSSKVQEAIDLLLSPEMRPALRRWYRQFGDDMNVTALQLREQLSQLAGERFG